MAHRKRAPAGLRINTPTNPAFSSSTTTLVLDAKENVGLTEKETTKDEGEKKPRRNMKNLSLNLSAQSSPTSSVKSGFSSLHSGLPAPSAKAFNPPPTPSGSGPRFRRPSVVSLPPKTAALVNRKENVDPENTPYADGPVQILPGIWLGSEDNARDFTGLAERKIKAILNVAKEVASPFDLFKPLRSFASTPNLNVAGSKEPSDNTYYPPHLASGRPGMHYLKLMWSHGQQDLVARGFPEAMAFTDAAAERGDGVLIHCQCGISRSATMVIALVMRAAAMRSPHVPDHVWALKGMQAAYDYVKQKSTCVGPNMSCVEFIIISSDILLMLNSNVRQIDISTTRL